MRRRWIQHGWPVLAGLAVTALAVAVFLSGLTWRLELAGYDFLVRHFGRSDASHEILHIDIDNDALERVGSWPWPRDLQAGLVEILADAGAERIVMDIVFSEPKPGEMRLPWLDRYAMVEGPVAVEGELSAENIVWPDLELADAIRRAGNVILPFYYEQYRERDAVEAAGDLGRRIAAILREDFGLGVGELAARLEVPADWVDEVSADIKRQIARERVGRLLDEKPELTARQVHEALLATPYERLTADRADVLAAYHYHLSLRALREQLPPVPDFMRGKIPMVETVAPPVYLLTQAAAGVGFVNFGPDVDGVTRRVPLMVEWDGRLIEQLAVRAARQELGIDLRDLSFNESGKIAVEGVFRRRPMEIPVEDDGCVMINWQVPQGDWTHSFKHLPVTALLQVADCRRNMADNRTRREYLLGEIVRLVQGEEGFGLYRRSVNEWLALRRQLRRAEMLGQQETQTLANRVERLRVAIEAEQRQNLEFAEQMWAQLSGEQNPDAPEIAADYKRFRRVHEMVAGSLAELEAANEALAVQEKRLLRGLELRIKDKTCFVGYTATAVADMVTTPPFGRLPGVMVHSNLYNNFLQGTFMEAAPRWAAALVVLMAGVWSVSQTAGSRPWVGLLGLLLMSAVFWLVNAFFFFHTLRAWGPWVTALITVGVAWAMVVLVRYLATERQRRKFSRALAQYVSPAVARQIAGAQVDFSLAPVEREVSCFFSDLAGFTAASERLGPAGTREVLNPYLQAMSDVLHGHNALINKFMGDGVFAFYNAPILACRDHARAACLSAIECQRKLAELGQRYRHHPLADEFAGLRMRIGLAAGPVYVGDYGSESKLDYTCMGDTVNLAARLESANKQFGTRILADGAVRTAAGDGLVWRYLGKIRVVGQTVATPVHELIGSAGEVDEATLRLAEQFDQALRAFAARQWDEAERLLKACADARPGDAGIALYLALIEQYRHHPPKEDWTGQVELRAK